MYLMKSNYNPTGTLLAQLMGTDQSGDVSTAPAKSCSCSSSFILRYKKIMSGNIGIYTVMVICQL